MTDLPIACSLDQAALRDRQQGTLADLLRASTDRRVLDDGARLSLPNENLPLLLQVIEAERQCCRFLRFRLSFEPDLGPLLLEITGPPGTGEFLRTTFGL